MRILLTGPSGFIGRHAIPYLLEGASDVHTVDIRPLPAEVTGVTHHTIDLLDAGRVRGWMAELRPTHLLHFAWYVTPGKYWTSLDNVRWLQASLDMVAAFLNCGGERSVIAGTCAEYDWTGDGLLHEQDTPMRPATLYGASKGALQMVHARMASQACSSSAWGRIFHLYGPHEPEPRLVPSIIQSILRGEPAKCSHGRQIRDFMHVDDVARAFVRLLYDPAEGAVNIASGQGVAIAEVARQIADILGRPDLLRLGSVPAPANDPPSLIADTVRLRGIGFTPQYSLEEGLRQTIGWWMGRANGPV